MYLCFFVVVDLFCYFALIQSQELDCVWSLMLEIMSGAHSPTHSGNVGSGLCGYGLCKLVNPFAQQTVNDFLILFKDFTVVITFLKLQGSSQNAATKLQDFVLNITTFGGFK